MITKHSIPQLLQVQFDAMEVGLADAPRADEIVVVLALTDAGRPLHRVGEDLDPSDVMAKN